MVLVVLLTARSLLLSTRASSTSSGRRTEASRASRATPPTRRPRPASTTTCRSSSTTTSTTSTTCRRRVSPSRAIRSAELVSPERRRPPPGPTGSPGRTRTARISWCPLGNGYEYNLQVTGPCATVPVVDIVATGTKTGTTSRLPHPRGADPPRLGRRLPDDRERRHQLRLEHGHDLREDLRRHRLGGTSTRSTAPPTRTSTPRAASTGSTTLLNGADATRSTRTRRSAGDHRADPVQPIRSLPGRHLSAQPRWRAST